ncbi:MAG: ABC transporter ATP-binding protein [Bacteroidetes bacterium]|nr:ABC transporter ATP-binding protein [Bacteroidota bacterium]
MRNLFNWFSRFWRQNIPDMMVVCCLTLLAIVFKIGFPILVKTIIDTLQVKFKIADVHNLIWVYLFAGIALELFGRILMLSRARMNLKFAEQIRAFYYKVFTLKGSRFFAKYRTGDLLTRLTDDIDGSFDRVSWFACSGTMRPIEAILVLGFTLSVMFYYSWELTLWSFLPLPLLVLIMSKTKEKLIRYTDEKQEAASNCNNVLENCFSGIRVIKSTASENDQLRKYEQVLENRISKENQFLKINQLVHLFSMLNNHAGTIIVIIVGSYFVIQNKIEIGTFFMFIIYLERLLEPLWTLSWAFASQKQIMRYAERLSQTEQDNDYETIALSTKYLSNQSFRSIKFENVSFQYDSATESVIRNLSFDVKAGEILAIVGEVGAGKTTILELIAQNLRPVSGQIFINGIDIQQISSSEISDFIGYVRQESILFSETIHQNLILGDSFSDIEIENALRHAQLTAEVQKFEEGLQSKLGQRGLSLSGGQKQRVSISRTLLRRPKLLLLDDCTAAMDAQTENNFWQSFKKNYPKTACIVVTHREQTMKQADRILYLE